MLRRQVVFISSAALQKKTFPLITILKHHDVKRLMATDMTTPSSSFEIGNLHQQKPQDEDNFLSHFDEEPEQKMSNENDFENDDEVVDDDLNKIILTTQVPKVQTGHGKNNNNYQQFQSPTNSSSS